MIESKVVMSSRELADYLGIKKYQLDYLLECRIIRPAQHRIAGRRVFGKEEIALAEQVVRERRERSKAQTGTKVKTAVPEVIVEVQHD